MSNKSRTFLILITSGIVVVFLVTLAAALAYSAGRNSVQIDRGNDNSIVVALDSPSNKPDLSELPKPTATHLPSETKVTEQAIAQDPPTLTPEPTLRTRVVTETVDAIPLNLDSDDLNLLLEVWDIVDDNFDGQLPSEEDVTFGAIIGSLELLDDRFTRFIPPDIAELTREQLEGFEGIGAFVDMNEEGYLLIVRPIQGQPAALAGLKDGDLVSHVDGDSVLGKSTEAIISEVKGPKGTSVTLTIIRESISEPFDVTITRDLIQIPTVESELLDNDIGYVRLSSFASNSDFELREAIGELFENNPQALILDLRDNLGGFLNQSVGIADLFLPEGIVLFQRDNNGREIIFESDDGDMAEDITLVVLVNEGSASASEIVAGAIQDRERGIIIGATTFGKGSVQRTLTLSDGSELRVTIARWYTPNNISINEEGITSDIQVETPEIFGGEEDTQLQRAIKFVLEGK